MVHTQTQAKSTNDQQDVLQAREERRNAFMQKCGWGDATLEALPADASFRRYYRVVGGKHPALLMEDPVDRPPVPPYVMVEPFVRIAAHLRDMGLSAPEIYEQDIENGLLLIEDFGNETYTRLLDEGVDAKELYEPAIDVLVHLHKHDKRNDIQLPAYDDAMMTEEAMLLVDWYYPALTGKKPADEMRESWKEVWKRALAHLPQDQKTFVLRDYHVDNIMRLSGRDGFASCGLLDFQDGVIGQFSYDVMSLLEDARRDMDADLKQHLYDRYLTGMGDALDREEFDFAFRVLAAQRHAKVLGIFVRLAVRDDKEHYLSYIPHVQKLLQETLRQPGMRILEEWFAEYDIDLAEPLVNFDKTKGFVL